MRCEDQGYPAGKPEGKMTSRHAQTSNKRSAEAIAFDQAVGERIKTRRTKLGIPQKSLVSMTGGSVSRYESGEVSCPIYKLALIAKALKCDTCALLKGIEP